jgi:hypothetical protein
LSNAPALNQCGSIDRAIALIGPNIGISPSLGLLDATGRFIGLSDPA